MDSSIQRSLLVSMVALEVVLVAASIWLVHWHLIQLIDESMYRMNVAHTGPTLMRLAQEGFAVLGLFAVVNMIALMLVAGIWSGHENLVLKDLIELIEKTRQLDFSCDAETQRQHEVLALAAAWRARERTRFAAIRDQVGKLETVVSAESSARDTRTSVESLNELLP